MVSGAKKRAISEYDQYAINEEGKIYILRSFVKEWNHYETVSTRIDRAGYITVRLHSQQKTSTKYLHRLLAEAFIPNPDLLNFVNHKDGNKLNNRICNLEWVNHSLNIKHAYDIGLIKSKARPVIDTCSGLVFKSTKAASKSAGLNPNTVKNYLRGIRPNPTRLRYL